MRLRSQRGARERPAFQTGARAATRRTERTLLRLRGRPEDWLLLRVSRPGRSPNSAERSHVRSLSSPFVTTGPCGRSVEVGARFARGLGHHADLHEKREDAASDAEPCSRFGDGGDREQTEQHERSGRLARQDETARGEGEGRADALGKALRRTGRPACAGTEAWRDHPRGELRERAEARSARDAGDEAVREGEGEPRLVRRDCDDGCQRDAARDGACRDFVDLVREAHATILGAPERLSTTRIRIHRIARRVAPRGRAASGRMGAWETTWAGAWHEELGLSDHVLRRGLRHLRHLRRRNGEVTPAMAEEQRAAAAVAAVAGALALAAVVAGSWKGDVHSAAIEPQVVAWSSAAAFTVAGVVLTRRLASMLGHVVAVRTIRAAGNAVRLLTSIVGYVVVLFTALGLLSVSIAHILTAGALTGVVLGIAAQQSLGNVFAGLVLLLARPFTIGDHVRIRSGSLGGIFDGVVLGMSLTYVTLSTDDGLLKVPNSAMLAAAVGPYKGPVTPATPGAPVVADAPRPDMPPDPFELLAERADDPAGDVPGGRADGEAV